MLSKVLLKLSDGNPGETKVTGAVYFEPDSTLMDAKTSKAPGSLDMELMLAATRLANFSYLEKSGCYWKSNKREKDDFRAQKAEDLSIGLLNALGLFHDVQLGMELTLLDSEFDQPCVPEVFEMHNGIIKHYLTDTDLVILRSEKKKTITVSWRGTESSSDVYSDVNFISELWPYSQKDEKLHVSKGFAKAHGSVINPLVQTLHKLWATGKYNRILVCGHSLGGALAHLNAHALSYLMEKELEKSDLPVEERLVCYTIGAPKAGNAVFLEDYTKRVPHTYRFINDQDVVPRIPIPRRNHVGIVVLMDEEYCVINPSKETFERLQEDDTDNDLIEDHFSPKYLRVVLSHYVRQIMTTEEEKAVNEAWGAYVEAPITRRITSLSVEDSSTNKHPSRRIVKPVIVEQPDEQPMREILKKAFGPERATDEVLDLLFLYTRKCLEVGIFRPWTNRYDDESIDLCAFRIACYQLLGNQGEKERLQAINQARLRKVYDVVDSDGNGLIDCEEYAEALRKASSDEETLKALEEHGALEVLHETYRKIFDEYGLVYPKDIMPTKISFEEFKLWAMKRNVNPVELYQKLVD